MSAEPVKVAIIPKNSTEEIHIALDHYAGRNLIDVRVFAKWNGSEVFSPTKKGVSITPDKLDAVIAALTEAEARAVALGWVE